jgi:DNA-binding transcriptional regulator YdaS (Cro superfamily)
MLKSKAIELLGGTVTAAAEAVGVTPSAVTQWPEALPDRIADRVLAALAKKHLPKLMASVNAPVKA